MPEKLIGVFSVVGMLVGESPRAEALSLTFNSLDRRPDFHRDVMLPLFLPHNNTQCTHAGFIYAMENIYVEERHRHLQPDGPDLEVCIQMIALVTPIVGLGAWLMGRVPSERMSKSRGFAWEVYFAFPIIASGIMAAITTMGYFFLRAFGEFASGSDWSGLGYMLGICGVTFYMWVLIKLIGAFETRGIKINLAKKRARMKKNKEKAEKYEKSMMANFCGTGTINEDDEVEDDKDI